MSLREPICDNKNNNNKVQTNKQTNNIDYISLETMSPEYQKFSQTYTSLAVLSVPSLLLSEQISFQDNYVDPIQMAYST